LREMEFAYRVARLKGDVPAREIFKMSLRGRRLSDPKSACAVRLGERADLVVLDLPGGSAGFASLVRASAGDIRLVIAGGRPWPRPSSPAPRRPRRRSPGPTRSTRRRHRT